MGLKKKIVKGKPVRYYSTRKRRSIYPKAYVEKKEIKMAKRKRKVRYVTKTVKKYRKSGAGSFNLRKLIVPIGVASVAEPLLDSYARTLPIPTIAGIQPDDMVKVALGYYFGKKGGLMGNTAKMLGIFGLRNIIAQFAGRAMGQVTQPDLFASTNGQGY